MKNKLLIGFLLCAATGFGQTTILPKTTVLPKTTALAGGAALGPVVCVQGGTGCTNATSTGNGVSFVNSIVFTFPNATTAGHTIVLAITYNNSVSSFSGGDTLTQAVTNTISGTNSSIYYNCNSAGGYTALTVNMSVASYVSGQIFELSGTPTSGCLDSTTASATGTSTAAATGSLAPAVSGEAFFAVQWNNNNTGTLTWASAQAQYSSNSNQLIQVADYITTTAASQNATWTITSASWTAAMAAFKP